MTRRLAALTTAALMAGTPSLAHAREGCRSKRCHERVAAKHRKAELARYHRYPMPRCTWHGESGADFGEWSWKRYRARNPRSTAGGKFQMLDATFHGVGGKDFPGTHDAAQASPVVQERLARRVLAAQGLGAWIFC